MYLRTKRLHLALKLAKKSVRFRRQIQGNDKLSTIDAIHLLGIVTNEAGQPACAEPLILEAIQREERVQGKDDPRIERYRRSLEVVRKSQAVASRE